MNTIMLFGVAFLALCAIAGWDEWISRRNEKHLRRMRQRLQDSSSIPSNLRPWSMWVKR